MNFEFNEKIYNEIINKLNKNNNIFSSEGYKKIGDHNFFIYWDSSIVIKNENCLKEILKFNQVKVNFITNNNNNIKRNIYSFKQLKTILI